MKEVDEEPQVEPSDSVSQIAPTTTTTQLSSRPKSATSYIIRKLHRRLNYESKRSQLLEEQLQHLRELNQHIC